ncbi:MAG: XRE family transcriptional regulator [Chloroflexota bacterium]|nr:XRE family transcriptional regulator [Chloroflexota bacterium]
MVVRATGINPEMLRWARERAGYSIEEVARRRRVPPERVKEWESGKSFPTWKQLKQLAHRDYHRSTVFFFRNGPPEEKTVIEHFPYLPEETLTDLHPDTLYAVRQARIRQNDLSELLGPDGSGGRLILRDLRVEADAGNPGSMTAAVREYLGVDLNDPEGFSNRIYTFEDFRSRIEDAGVWVFKRNFRQEDVTGLCLDDDVYPVIYVSNGQDKAQEIFTLFNELMHLLFGFNYLERTEKRHYLTSMTNISPEIENACNQFASEFYNAVERAMDYPIIYAYASVDYTESAWGTGDREFYYTVQGANLGRKYLRTAFNAFEEGQVNESDLASLLGAKGHHLDGLERYAWR